MEYRVSDLDDARCARLLTAMVIPRPIAWVVSQSSAGVRNAAPFSFFNALCSWPPVLGLGVQPRAGGAAKDTVANILETGEFTVNLVNFTEAGAMNATSADLAPEANELELAAIATMPSSIVQVPRIAEAPGSFECTLRQAIPVEHGCTIILGDVAAIFVADFALEDSLKPYVDGNLLDLVGRMHGRGQYVRAQSNFALARPATPKDEMTL